MNNKKISNDLRSLGGSKGYQTKRNSLMKRCVICNSTQHDDQLEGEGPIRFWVVHPEYDGQFVCSRCSTSVKVTLQDFEYESSEFMK